MLTTMSGINERRRTGYFRLGIVLCSFFLFLWLAETSRAQQQPRPGQHVKINFAFRIAGCKSEVPEIGR